MIRTRLSEKHSRSHLAQWRTGLVLLAGVVIALGCSSSGGNSQVDGGVPDGAPGVDAPPPDSDRCTQACEYSLDCGHDYCGSGSLDCSRRHMACQAECLLNASCEAIASLWTWEEDLDLYRCLSFLEPDSATRCGISPDSATYCSYCMLANCTAARRDCFESTDCKNYLNSCYTPCLSSLSPTECKTKCDSEQAAGATLAAGYFSCACTACQQECYASLSPPCGAL